MPSTATLSHLPHARITLEKIQAVVADDLLGVDQVITTNLYSEVALIDQVAEHIIHSGGKRLRPLLTVLSARASGYRSDNHVTLAAIVEFIHTATLLHDDVVDDSKLRRGQLTANAKFGNEASVLVGDFLYSRAFQMLVTVGSMRIMEIMAETTNAIAEGEVMQLLNCRNPDTTEENYLRVIHAKTATLFEAAARLGAVCADAGTVVERGLADFGRHLGVAYQLVDDVLDYRGSANEIGKNVGDDLAEGKPTLPLIYALRRSDDADRALIRGAIENGDLENIDAVITAVERTGAIDYTSRRARDEARSARDAIVALPESSFRDSLEALAEFAVSRTY